MKKKFVFDSMESDFSDISEETIIENTGVNTERVVNTVMKATTAKKIRRFTKRGIIGIAAAVAAAVVISTVSVGAAGGFNQVFGNWFAGQPKYGLFSGSNVSTKSDNLAVEFEGIAGDDNFVGAVMQIKNSDGSKFVENNDGKYIIFGSNDVDVTLSPIAALFSDNSNRGGSVWYDMKDENTIQATALYQDFSSHLKGERMTVKENQLTIMHLDEEIGTCLDNYDELEKKYKNKLGEDKGIFSYSKSGAYEDNKYYIVTEKVLPFEFEVSATLNYKTSSRALSDLNGKEFSMNGVTMTVDNLYAKSFGIDMQATVSPMDFPEVPELDETDPVASSTELHDYHEKMNALGFKVEFDITMKDGSKITAEADSRNIPSNSETSSAGVINCRYMKDGIATAIDPDEIESITATAKPLEKY